MIQYALIALITAVVTLGLSFVVYKLALRYKWYPAIRERDVHTRPTPRLGGAAMFIGVVAAFAIAPLSPFLRTTFETSPVEILTILGASLFIVVIGVVDDIIDLDWMVKLAAQFIAAGAIAFSGVQIYSLPIGGITVGSAGMSFAMTVFAIVLVMNAVNFIDGLDGLVAGVGLIANGVFLVYGYLLVRETGQTSFFNLSLLISAVLVGVCAGFLPLNWHPAKMFMGDAGALLVGLLMATSAVAITGQISPGIVGQGVDGPALIGRSQLIGAFIPIILPFAILVIPLLDFALAIFRRLRAGKSPFSADRKHLHHRLLDMGHSHLHAVLIFYAWTAVLAVACLLFLVFQPYWLAIVFLAVGVVVCTIVTFAPLGQRKAAEISAQSAPEGTGDAERLAEYDPLDEASIEAHPLEATPIEASPVTPPDSSTDKGTP